MNDDDRITRPDHKLSYAEIVAELTRLLYGTADPTEDQCDQGGTITLSYEQFRKLTNRRQFGFHFWISLLWETEDSWIIIGYGHKQEAILVGANSHYAPLS